MPDKPTVQRPYLAVVGSDAADIVPHAGGLICDRVRQGWRVVILVPTDTDSRATHPLRILGADICPLDAPPDGLRDARTALMTSASLYATDRAIRSDVDAALAAKSVEVLVWGSPAGPRTTTVAHRLSAAASAFKAHALAAAGLDQPVGATESFHTRCATHVIARELDVAG